jgi:hypothetical protein
MKCASARRKSLSSDIDTHTANVRLYNQSALYLIYFIKSTNGDANTSISSTETSVEKNERFSSFASVVCVAVKRRYYVVWHVSNYLYIDPSKPLLFFRQDVSKDQEKKMQRVLLKEFKTSFQK